MERLTFESDGYLAVRGKDCLEDQNGDYFGPAIARLAAYEETGLTPDDVVDLMGNHGMALSELAKVPQWIPVTERLPEKQADVLIYFGGKYKNMATGFWHGEEKMNAVYWCAYTDDGFYTDCDYKPTHWMPLPKAPGKDGA